MLIFRKHKSSLIFYLELLILFTLPIILILFGIIPFEKRFYFLPLFFITIFVILKLEHYSNKDLGLVKTNIKKLIFPYILFTILGLFFIYLIHKAMNLPFYFNWYYDSLFILSFIPVCIFQELVYRGYLMHETKRFVKYDSLVIIINIILFTLLHAIYPNMVLSLYIGFTAGVAFTFMYYYFPNLYLITISHIILNFSVKLFGIY